MQLNNRKTNSTFKKWAEDSNRNYYKDDRQIDNKHEKMLGIIHYLLLFSRSIVSDSVLYCPSPPPGACSNSCPLSQWCHPTILSTVTPFFSYLQSFATLEAVLPSIPACILFHSSTGEGNVSCNLTDLGPERTDTFWGTLRTWTADSSCVSHSSKMHTMRAAIASASWVVSSINYPAGS